MIFNKKEKQTVSLQRLLHLQQFSCTKFTQINRLYFLLHLSQIMCTYTFEMGIQNICIYPAIKLYLCHFHTFFAWYRRSKVLEYVLWWAQQRGQNDDRDGHNLATWIIRSLSGRNYKPSIQKRHCALGSYYCGRFSINSMKLWLSSTFQQLVHTLTALHSMERLTAAVLLQ